MDDREWMRRRVETIFTSDARGRIVSTNEPRPEARSPAPRLFLGRTAAGHLVRVGAAVPESLARRLEHLLLPLLPPDDLQAPLPGLTTVRELLAQHAPITMEGRGLTYRFPSSITPPREAVVRLTGANRALLRDTYPWLYAELVDWQPCYGVVREGAAVSVCFSSRRGLNGAAAGVATHPAFRGRGFATAVTRAWGAAVRETGRIPFYGTAWENEASQAVARRTGLILFGTDTTWT